jgi:hypothetical protein
MVIAGSVKRQWAPWCVAPSCIGRHCLRVHAACQELFAECIGSVRRRPFSCYVSSALHARFDERPVRSRLPRPGGPHRGPPAARARRPSPPPVPRGRAADPAAVSVVRARSAALRRGDVQGAARYFAPSEFINGPDASGRVPIIPIRSLAEAAAVNASLPCGARFISADQRGAYAMRSFASLRGRGPAEAAAPAPARWRARIS